MSALASTRVLFVLNWAELGGAERNALTVAEELRHREADVGVLALTARDGAARQLFRERGIPWHGYDLHWHGNRLAKARVVATLGSRLRARRPNVVMPYCTAANVLCGLVWRWSGAGLCVWNQRDVNPSRRFGSTAIGRSLEQTPLALANSETARAFLVSEWGAHADRVHVVYDRVEPALAIDDRATWRRRLGASDDRVVACMSAHLHAFKDHATLLRAWRLVVDGSGDGAAPLLALAGREAGTQDSVKALAYDLELSSSVRFLGDVRDIGGLLAASDIGVLSSPRESCPRAVIEYMAAGLPVAGTGIPAMRELLGEGGRPFLGRPGNADELAAVLLELVRSANLRHEAGAANERLAQERFASAGGAEHTASLIAGVIEQQATR